MWKQRFAEVKLPGMRGDVCEYHASTNPDGSVRYSWRSKRGFYYETRPSDVPRPIKRQLDKQLATQENPLSTQEWLLIGLGALVIGGMGYAIYTTYQSWPPSATVQQGILNQITSAQLAMGGSSPSATQTAQLQAAIAQLPNSYAQSISPAQPTVSGYQAYASNWINSYISSSGYPGGIANVLS